MSDEPRTAETRPSRTPWNKGKLTGPKPPLKVREIWAIRIRLQLAERRSSGSMVDGSTGRSLMTVSPSPPWIRRARTTMPALFKARWGVSNKSARGLRRLPRLAGKTPG